MKSLSPFQIILLVVSGIVIIVGVLMFAFARTAQNAEEGVVVVWGTVPLATMESLNDFFDSEKKIKQTIEYREIPGDEFDEVLVEALAEGTGPDVVMITDDRLVRHKGKLLQIDYEFYPQRLFKDTYIESGEIFTDDTGIYAFPFLVDPLVLYWNRALFTDAGLSQPPRYWDELLTMAPQLTKRDSSLAIEQSAIAMGDYANVNHAKEIITTLFFQAGNPIVSRNQEVTEASGEYSVTLDDKLDFTVSPAQAAVNFYTQFADPSRTVYTWNRSLQGSLDAFVANDVAMYVGYASEFATIRAKNPNLNFDVAVMPQSRSGTLSTYGRVLALAIPKTTPNVERAYALIQNMTSADTVATVSDLLFLPPVRRDVLAVKPANAFMQTFHDSALRARTWFDLDPRETEQIFKRMIESVVTGRLATTEAVQRANDELELLK